MILVLAVHCVVGAVLFPLGTRLGRRVFFIAAAAPVTTLIWLTAHLDRVLDGRDVVEHVSWVSELGLGIDLRLDAFGALMVAVVSGIGVIVCVYSATYFSSTSAGISRTAGLLVLFAGAMLVVVTADNLLLLYTGWELTSVSSYLLIGNDHTKLHARAAALHALLVTSMGGLVMLAGFVLLGQAAGTYRLSSILREPPTGTTVTVAVFLILIGAFTKSAQYPFHAWLPGAMAAPTPVSAYLHSATMVKAGIYLIARLSPAFAGTAGWRPVVLTVGVVTMILGGLRAMRQIDLKLLLAFGTVSQLGFLVVLFGIGSPAATAAGCAMLVAHAVFKAALFMAVGAVDRSTGTRDLRLVPQLGRGWRTFRLATCASAASMAGVPLLFGFVSKEAGFEAALHAPFSGHTFVVVGIVAGSGITAAYTLRFLWGMFGRASQRLREVPGAASADAPDRPRAGFVVPGALLALFSVVTGVLPRLLDRFVGTAATALDGREVPEHLALWHGLNLALGLSALAIGSGACLFLARGTIDRVLAIGRAVPSGTQVYTSLLRGTNTLSTRVTGVIQNGSLPIYAGVVLLTAAVVPGAVLVAHASWPGWPQWVGSWGQLPVVVALLGAAIAAALVRRRFSAALFLGTAGYAMAGLFVVQGAPDLALTQVAIETLSTVLFVLVLRRLPDRFERTSSTRRRVVRVLISASVGVMVFLFAIISRGNRTANPVSGEMIERSLPDGHGRNVVNVILVDIRGFDTLGEITVLASAAIGAVALARVGRRRRSSP